MTRFSIQDADKYRVSRWLGVAGISVLLLSGCAGEPATMQQNDQPGDQLDLEHIHGLGINPADNQLYAASHHGMFLVTGQAEPQQIAGRTQDFMGFTIVGPDHFLGSGHPAPGDNEQPSHVGLIESTDGANTWQTVSLSGEVDFHALEAAHGKVYGYDSRSGQIMVSSDKKNWDRRATLSAADLAVSPDESKVVMATTERGPAVSTDGGRSFATMDAAPVLVFLDWPTADRLAGVAPDGTVYVSEDGGDNWREQGQVPDSPQAILVHGKSDVYVATEKAIYRSTDDGKTFQVFQPLS